MSCAAIVFAHDRHLMRSTKPPGELQRCAGVGWIKFDKTVEAQAKRAGAAKLDVHLYGIHKESIRNQ